LQPLGAPRSQLPAAAAAPPDLTVVVPAYNEEAAIGEEIDRLHAALGASGLAYELVVVDDGSDDRTFELASAKRCTVLRHAGNRGYGAALKHGFARARSEWVAITDADATYPAPAILELWARRGEADMVVAARTGTRVAIPFVRRPAKWFLNRLASFLVGRRIPDLNSGLRLIRRADVQRFAHILPDGFSFTSTITLALLATGRVVAWVPIDYARRVGRSKIRPFHAYEFLLLVLRIVVLFNPLKVFLPLGAICFAGGFAKFVHDLWIGNLSETAVMGFLAGLVIWTLGLLADQNARFNLDRDAWNG
jgi:glycosyltransferase involved in cell wall biosynthesis